MKCHVLAQGIEIAAQSGKFPLTLHSSQCLGFLLFIVKKHHTLVTFPFPIKKPQLILSWILITQHVYYFCISAFSVYLLCTHALGTDSGMMKTRMAPAHTELGSLSGRIHHKPTCDVVIFAVNIVMENDCVQRGYLACLLGSNRQGNSPGKVRTRARGEKVNWMKVVDGPGSSLLARINSCPPSALP